MTAFTCDRGGDPFWHDCARMPCAYCPWRKCQWGCGQTAEECLCEPDYEEEPVEEHDCGEDTCVCLEPRS